MHSQHNKLNPLNAKDKMFVSNINDSYIVYAYLCFGRGFHEIAVVKLTREIQALIFANHPFIFQVTLIAD